MVALSLIAAGCGSTTLYTGPRFATGVAGQADAAAIEVDKDGRIIAVHHTVPEHGNVVRLPGKLAVPGLHDAHLHLSGIGERLEQVDLRDVSSPAMLRQRIADFARAHPQAQAIHGRGWDQSRWPGKTYPTAQDIAGATDRPVFVRRVDGHAGLANDVLLQRAAIGQQTADPAGGKLLRDAKGQPTGTLIDRAMELVSAHLPRPSTADRRRWLRMGAEACARAGLVAVHDMAVEVATLQAMVAEDATQPLPLRVFVYLDGDDPAAWRWLAENLGAKRQPSPRIAVRGIKLFADGALGSRGAALLEDYADRPGQKGLLLSTPQALAEATRRTHELDAQVAIHGIGDRGNRVALDAIAAAQGADRSRRHRLEHAQVLHDDDLGRLHQSGVIASMQPTHATSDKHWAAKRLGATRLSGAYAWQRVLATGATLALGSDAPVESERVLLGLHAATTRTDIKGEPAGGWRPEERLDDARAIAGFSLGAAFAVGRETELGSLVVGKLFDVTVFGVDPRGQVGGWLNARPLQTWIGGVKQAP